MIKTNNNNNVNFSHLGNFLHLSLKQNVSQHTLTSPLFGLTKESCKLELYSSQLGMSQGTLRVVIEPIEFEDSKGGHFSSSWVPSEQRGNDRGHWEPFVFPIGRVTQPFHILLEVVPSKQYRSNRGYISIDNLMLKNCFRDEVNQGTCSVSDVRCQREGKDMCIKSGSVCDINNDCDDKADELLNCGEFVFWSAEYSS